MSKLLIDDVQDLINRYVEWLKNTTILRQLDEDWVEIETPYLDRHNDFLSIYVRRKGDYFELTDGGYIINDLVMSGVSFDKKNRQEMLRQTLNGFGVKKEENMLYVYASPENFPVRKHSLIQAMLTIDDVFSTSTVPTGQFFLEDVKNWLDRNDVRYTDTIKICGRTGFDQMFNFVIPKSKKFPERFVHTLNNPQKSSIQDIVFKWEDIKDMRQEARLYVVLNDTTKTLSDGMLTALRNYELLPFAWRSIDNHKEEFAA